MKSQILALLTIIPLSLNAKTITDSLVQELSCEQLSVKSIYSSIKEEAFSEKNQIRTQNWATGVIANCWSLSHAQRIHFYLNRVNQDFDQITATQNQEDILNMLRGSKPDLIHQPMTTPKEVENKLKNFSVYQLPESSYLEDLEARSKMSNGSFLDRNFKKEIENYQVRRFNHPSNLGKFVLSGPNSAQDNEILIKKLLANLNEKKLTLLNLRATKTMQHVVVAKNYSIDGNGNILISVYDSNNPDINNTLIYHSDEKMFRAPKIMGYFFEYVNKSSDSILDTYIVDEEDRTLIEQALLKHYKQLCSN